ncbi:MAG: hypothetical protein KGS72_14245 [Cyanobacteria bacterium REEB67]|nr:hypothetical protein [Cyanobacteria bacterium REEB67]
MKSKLWAIGRSDLDFCAVALSLALGLNLTVLAPVLAVGDTAASDQNAAKSSDAKSEKAIGAKLKEARLAMIDKKYQEALDDYLWVFENSRQLKTWQGVRNAYVSQELVKLAEVFPPAKEEVLKLRDSREKLILEDKAQCSDVQDWAILNHNLTDDRRSVSIYKQLNARGQSTDQVCDWIEECIPVSLVRAREYKELLPWAEKSAVTHIATVEESEKKGFSGRLALPLVLENVYACYEVLLAEGKEAEADKLAQCILRPWSSHDMFAAFVRAARRTNHPAQADQLLAQARKKVSATDYELILGEIKPGGQAH